MQPPIFCFQKTGGVGCLLAYLFGERGTNHNLEFNLILVLLKWPAV